MKFEQIEIVTKALAKVPNGASTLYELLINLPESIQEGWCFYENQKGDLVIEDNGEPIFIIELSEGENEIWDADDYTYQIKNNQ